MLQIKTFTNVSDFIYLLNAPCNYNMGQQNIKITFDYKWLVP